MDSKQVKNIREKLGTNDVVVFFTDAQYVNGNLEGTNMVWDDENQLLHSCTINDYRCQSLEVNKPFLLESRAYDTIDTISLNANLKIVSEWLDRLKAANLITEERANQIYLEYKNLNIGSNLTVHNYKASR